MRASSGLVCCMQQRMSVPGESRTHRTRRYHAHTRSTPPSHLTLKRIQPSTQSSTTSPSQEQAPLPPPPGVGDPVVSVPPNRIRANGETASEVGGAAVVLCGWRCNSEARKSGACQKRRGEAMWVCHLGSNHEQRLETSSLSLRRRGIEKKSGSVVSGAR